MADARSTHRVLRELRSRILRGDLLPGEQLKQEQLAAELDVSRVPVREALMVLANQGLLTHRPNQGFVIAKRTWEELAQVHLVLSLLERELLTHCTWPDRATVLRLRKLNRHMAELVDEKDWIGLVELNHEFHQTLWQLSRLKLIADEVERVWGLADAYIADSYRSRAHRAAAVEQHDAIIDALAARDPELLLQANTVHRQSTFGAATEAIAAAL